MKGVGYVGKDMPKRGECNTRVCRDRREGAKICVNATPSPPQSQNQRRLRGEYAANLLKRMVGCAGLEPATR
jgi:hypothetical protein